MAEASSGETERCERRGCEREPTHELITESPILHRKPVRWPLCDEHARVAAEEFRGATNILAARSTTASGATKPHLVTDGGTSSSEAERVVFADRYPEMPDKLEVLLGDSGFIVPASPVFSKDRVLVQFDENKTGRPGGERHWIPERCLKPGKQQNGGDS